jgi:hypothetical protein
MVKENEPKFRQFIVDADAFDQDGADISDGQFGSGGARRADGTLINQYRNPRPYNPGAADSDREFDDWLSRESEARAQREETESQAAHDRRVQKTADEIMWVLRDVVTPIARAYWEARGREDAHRFGQWVTSRIRGAAHKKAEESHPSDEATFPVGAAKTSATTIDTPIGIINLDDYRRRGTKTESVANGEDATTA